MNTSIHRLGGIIQTEYVSTSVDVLCFLVDCVFLSCSVFEPEFYSLCGTNVPLLSSSRSKFSNALRTSGCHGNGHLGYKFIFVTRQREKLRIT